MAREKYGRRAATDHESRKFKASNYASKAYQASHKNQKTISTLPILTRVAHNDPKKLSRVTKKPKEADILGDYRNTIESAGDVIWETYPAALNQTRDELVAAVTSAQDKSQRFSKDMMRTVLKATATFATEETQTEYERCGKKYGEKKKLGETIEKFKDLYETTRTGFKKEWVKWVKIQEQIVDLGVSVLGREAFEGYTGEVKGKPAYMEELELLEAEHNATMKEFNKEISALGTEFVDKLIAADTAITIRFEQQQAEIRRYIRDME